MSAKTPKFDAALDAIFAELKPHTRVCAETGESFEITERDIEMLKLLRVPPPKTTWWASNRRKRAFIGGYEFFRRVLPDGRDVVSMFDPESSTKIMPVVEWHAFDHSAHARDCDSNAPFFDQWKALSSEVTRPAIMQDTKSVNSEYALYSSQAKNCYYTVTGVGLEDLTYADMCISVKNSVEVLQLTRCEWSYSSVSCTDCSRVIFSWSCERCVDVAFSFGCTDCSDCFACTNKKNKRFCFLDEQLTEEEYRKRVSEIDLSDARVVDDWKMRIRPLWDQAYRKGFTIRRSEDASGDEIEDSRSVEGVTIVKSERAYYGVGLVGSGGRDCLDFTSSVGCERCYNFARTFNAFENRMTFACDNCIDVEYSELLSNCEHCFGCFGLKHRKFCVFNKQYEEDDYWTLVDGLKTAMLERGEYGEFFPYRLSPFAYNGSHAMSMYPMTGEAARQVGARWYDFDAEKRASATSIDGLPYRLDDVTDDVLKERFQCPVSGRAFGFVRPELDFHRRMGLALPRVHPVVRYRELTSILLPFRLYDRNCDSCGVKMKTRNGPTVTAPVLCQSCYEKVAIGEKPAPRTVA